MEIFCVEFETFAVEKEEKLRQKASPTDGGPLIPTGNSKNTKQVIPY